jgi:D-alanine-D-alanine ligase
MSTVVAVLRGGPSNEHEVSLKSGHTFVQNLHQPEFTVRDIYIDKAGVWHERGKPTTPAHVLPTTDVALIAVHGAYGHDGTLQKILDQYGVAHTGATAFHAHQASHKVLAKEHAARIGLLTPKYRYVEDLSSASDIALDVVRSFMQPVVVKPVSDGSSFGVSLVTGYRPLMQAIETILNKGGKGVLIEERIKGREATVGVVDGLRGEVLYGLPPVEILPAQGHDFFSFDAKYSGKSEEICPGRFDDTTTAELLEMAKAIHVELGQRHYSRSDFMISPRGIYFLELNTAAAVGMTGESLFPKALAARGVGMPEFLSHVISQARGY